MVTRFNTGVSMEDDSSEAAVDALHNAETDYPLSETDFVAVFCSTEYDYREVIDTIREKTGEATLVGSSSAGEFTERGPTTGSLTVATVKSDEMKFYSAIGGGLSDDNIDSAIEEAATALPESVDGYPHTAGINLHDGLLGRGEEIALTSYNYRPMRYTGGSAGDDLELEETYVFANDEIRKEAVALGMIASKNPFGQSVGHGHREIAGPFKVTEADGSVVHELDGRPAYEVWEEHASPVVKESDDYDSTLEEYPEDDLVTPLTRFEFGIKTNEDQYKIRWPGLTPDKSGPMHFATKIPEGVNLYLMDSTTEQQLSAAEETSLNAISEDGKYSGGFIFDCVCQSIIMGDEFDKSIDAINDVLGVPFAGFETYGEVCITPEDLRAYHNTTSSILLLPE